MSVPTMVVSEKSSSNSTTVKDTSSGKVSYTITFKTGFKFGGWTNDNVYIKLNDIDGITSETKNFRIDDKNAFTRGSLHEFRHLSKIMIGKEPRIELWREGGWLSCWYIDWITIKDSEADLDESTFPVQKWIKKDQRYFFSHIGTCLPQKDAHSGLRKLELKTLQKEYQLQVKEPGLPAQIKVLPDDEKFSCLEYVYFGWENHIYELEKERLLRDSKGNTSLRGCELMWKSFKDVQTVYSDVFGTPKGSEHFNDDASFGRQRLNGLNPSLIQRCLEIPKNFKVSVEIINQNLQKTTIEKAIKEGNLFIINLNLLSACKPQSGCVMTSPLALFHFDVKLEQLMPIAIQLFQEPADTVHNPVFYPSDPEYTWMFAKMWYSLADATYHQALTHLNFTHLMMEGISVTTKRQLAPSHPIMKLLNPHFLYLMAIDSIALGKLLNSGGFIDKTSNAGIEGHFDIMRESMKLWSLESDGNLNKNLKKRGIYPKMLGKAYHFRDDALLLYSAIEKYVDEYVQHYYGNRTYNQLLQHDHELQAWGEEMFKKREKGGLGILGVPNKGCFVNKDQLVQTLTPIIYTCSVGHAAANFQQYDEYGDPFNYPYALAGEPPKDKTSVTEKTILNAIANKAQLLELMSITKILSNKTTKSLGDFEEKLIVDPPAQAIVKRFQQNLLEIGKEIDKRNENRTYPYVWLHPTHIPNAISI